MLQISHVLHSPGYQPSADLHYVLAWAIAVNLLSTSVVAAFQPRRGWSRGLPWIWLSDWTSSLLPLVLVRALRIPTVDHRMHMFGLIYTFFVFAKLSTLVASGSTPARLQRSEDPVSDLLRLLCRLL